MSFETPEQLAAGIALTKKTAREFAAEAKIAPMTLSRILNSDESLKNMRPHTRKCLEKCFALYDIEFTEENGVKKRANVIRTLRGKDAMSDFLDDVYNTSVKHGTKESPTPVYLSNVVHTNWVKWMGPERWENHRQRMTEDRDLMDVRIITREGDPNFLTLKYSKYKWMKEQYFNDKSFYSYHDRLAFLDFKEDDLTIHIIFQTDFAKGYRDLFLIAWDALAVNPPKELLEKALKEQG